MSAHRAGLMAAVCLLALGLPSTRPRAMAGASPLQPIALAAERSGGVVILDRDGGLYRFDPRSGHTSTVVAKIDGFRQVDLAVTSDGGETAVYITQYRRGSDAASILRLVRYTLDGRRTGLWYAVSQDLFAGVAVRGEVAYLVGSLTREVTRVTIGGDRARRRFLTGLPGSGRPGPIALDPRSGAIFVGDIGEFGRGAVYRTDVEGSRPARILGELGQPLALAVDPGRDRLLILDAHRGEVRTLALGADRLDPEPWVVLEDWKEPAGLAVSDSGTVWVGDGGLGTLTEISSEGRTIAVHDLRP